MDIQLTLQAHLNHASVATSPQELSDHLAAFSRDWKKEPTLEQFDAGLNLLRDQKSPASSETVSLWWLGYVQLCVLSEQIDTLSSELTHALLKAADSLANLLQSNSGTIVKRAIQVCASIYPVAFRICCQNTDQHVNLWNEYAIRIKKLVLGQNFGSSNEGILISVCKYMQTVIQTQSISQPNSTPKELDASLDRIPPNHPYLVRDMLHQEADRFLGEILTVVQRPMVSSTIVTAIINQTSALQRTRPQFMPFILSKWTAFTKSIPPHFSALQTKFIDKSIRIQLISLARMQLQAQQSDALTAILSSYGIRFSGGALSRSQQQQLLQKDRDNGDDSRRSGKRARAANGDDEMDMKRAKSEIDVHTPPPQALPPPPPPLPIIPPGFGQTLLGQINITQLPVHHVVDIIFETLAANPVPHLFHSFLSTLPSMPLKHGPLPLPPPGVGPPPPGLLQQFPPPPHMPGMMPPPGFLPPPPHMLPPGPGGSMPGLKQEPKREPNLANLQLPTVGNETRVSTIVMAPKHTPLRLPGRPVAVKSDGVILGKTAARKDSSPEHESKKEIKLAPEESQQKLKQETLKLKLVELEAPAASTTPGNDKDANRQLLKAAFERILESENVISVPGATGRKMLEAAAAGHSQEGASSNALVPFEPAEEGHATKVVTKADWMTIVSRLLTRAFPTDAELDSTVPKMKQLMVEYICQDFKQRRELALTWLHEEWYYDNQTRLQEDGSERQPQYLWCLYKILDGITSGTTRLDAKDRGLTRFLLEVPELPDGAVEVIQRYCDDPDRAQLGITCLRDIVNLRPPSRDRALELILQYTTHQEKLQRSIAIVTTKKWYLEHPTVGPKVEDFALAQLESLKDIEEPNRETFEERHHQSSIQPHEGHNAQGMDGVEITGSTPAAQPLVKTEIKTEPKIEEDNTQIKEMSSEPSSLTTLSHSAGTSTLSFEQAAKDAEDNIGRILDLYFSLCAKNHGLLGVMFDNYISYSPFVQKAIRTRIQPLINSVKSDSPKLLALIRNFPMGAEMLALRIVVLLTDAAKPSAGLVEAVQAAVTQHDLNARFLIPIMGGLTKEEVIASLPRIVSLLKNTERERRIVTDVFIKLLTGTAGTPAGASAATSGSSTQPPAQGRTDGANGAAGALVPLPQQPSGSTSANPPRGLVLSPSELLIQLHSMEDTVGWKAACEAIDICFNHPEIFKSEIIAVVLQQLLDQPQIPSLFMRTVIQAITLYKNLVGFVNSMILARLVAKKVWTRPVLWKGFIRCAKVMQPTSSSVLASLPKPQLKEVLAQEPSLKESVDAYVKAKSSGRRVGGGVTKQLNVQNVAAAAAAAPAPAEVNENTAERIEQEETTIVKSDPQEEVM